MVAEIDDKPGRQKRTIFWIVAGAVVVGGFVLVPILLSAGVLLPALCNCVGTNATPIGTAFAVQNPWLAQCPTGATYGAEGCAAGDYVYEMTVLGSSVSFDSVRFQVNNSSGSVAMVATPGGFTVVNSTGSPLASSSPGTVLEMNDTWTSYGPGISGSSLLKGTYSVLVDMGVGDPLALGYTFVALGLPPYYGSTAAALP